MIDFLIIFGLVFVPILIFILSVYFVYKLLEKKREEKISEHILDNKWKIIERDLKEQSENLERHYIRLK